MWKGSPEIGYPFFSSFRIKYFIMSEKLKIFHEEKTIGEWAKMIEVDEGVIANNIASGKIGLDCLVPSPFTEPVEHERIWKIVRPFVDDIQNRMRTKRVLQELMGKY